VFGISNNYGQSNLRDGLLWRVQAVKDVANELRDAARGAKVKVENMHQSFRCNPHAASIVCGNPIQDYRPGHEPL
jgi:hypothetical protein